MAQVNIGHDNNNNNTNVTKRSSILLANKNVSLTKYIESVRKKQSEDPDCAKWDVSVGIKKLITLSLSL